MKKIYYLFEFLLILAFIFLSNYARLKVIDFLLVFLFILVSQLFKMIRLYLIFLDYKLPVTEFVFNYTRGTIFSIIVPFKLGEIYKWRLFSNLIQDNMKSFILIVIDRFYDTIGLCLLLLPYIALGRNTFISVLSIVIIITLITLFFVFDGSYKYLNNFLILNSKTDRGIKLLRLLEKLKENYNYINDVIDGKKIIILVSSLLAWSFELLAFIFFANRTGVLFYYGDFVESLNSNFASFLKSEYLIYCIITLFIVYLFTIGREIYERNSSHNR